MTPYNSILYHLDLSIMAYHLYAQTLIWPWDPFYEQARHQGSSRRNNFMGKVRDSLTHTPRNNSSCPDHLDPILSDYIRLNPTKNAIFRPDGGTHWEVFKPIPEIITRIKSTRLVIDTKVKPRKIYSQTGTDRLYYFEGKTGMSWDRISAPIDGQKTILGYILERQLDPNDPSKYDLHIAFRGSRSGNATTALGEAYSSNKGNPDWVTDMQFSTMESTTEISDTGKISYGFASSILSAKTNIFKCFEFIHGKRNNNPPRKIWTTGHSLGGALAGLFAYMINTKIPELTNSLTPDWEYPIRNINVLTFGAPVIGDWDFINAYNSKISCKRIKVHLDPVTTDMKGFHAGARIQTSSHSRKPTPALADNHRYDVIRDKVINVLGLKPNNPFNGGMPKSTSIVAYQSFGKIPKDSYNGKKCALSVAPAQSFDNLNSYIPILTTILSDKKSYVSKTLDSTINRRKSYLNQIVANSEYKKLSNANYTLNNINFQLALKTTIDDDVKWRNFLYLACIMTQIHNGQDFSWDNGDFISGLINKI